jgi:hypothetical protein
MVGVVFTFSVKLVVEVALQLSVAVTVTVYVPAGPALLIVTTPVVWFTLKLPVKPGAEAEMLLIETLSLGGALGVTVVPAPTLIVPADGYVPSTGGVLAVTVTFKVALADKPPLSVTVSVKLAFDTLHAATTFAVTTPVLPTLRPETVTPLTDALAPPLTVTVKVFSASSASLTLAIVELAEGLPCWRLMPTALIVGGVFAMHVLSRIATVLYGL